MFLMLVKNKHIFFIPKTKVVHNVITTNSFKNNDYQTTLFNNELIFLHKKLSK